MRPSCDDNFPLSSEPGGQSVGFRCEPAKERQGNQIGVRVKPDRLDLLVNHPYLMPRWRNRRQVDSRDRRNEVDLMPSLVPRDVDDDDVDLHGRAPRQRRGEWPQSTLYYKVIYRATPTPGRLL